MAEELDGISKTLKSILGLLTELRVLQEQMLEELVKLNNTDNDDYVEKTKKPGNKGYNNRTGVKRGAVQ